jgi:hypothetical protein
VDVNTISNLTASATQGQTGDAVNLRMLKESLRLQGELALQMIEALPQMPVNPPNLGQNIDLIA